MANTKVKKVSAAHLAVLASVTDDGCVEPMGRYRTLDAMERAGLVVSVVCRGGVFRQPLTRRDRYHHDGTRDDHFEITKAGRAALAAAKATK